MTDIPDYVDPEALIDYMEMRKRIKKPMTERRMRQFMNRMQALRDAGHDVNQSLDEAADAGWLDLYEPKDKGIRRAHSAAPTASAQRWIEEHSQPVELAADRRKEISERLAAAKLSIVRKTA